ncbi:hypothetical protein MLD38_016817 [Melastoma candidum]|uniref:Uncharacterized protein n=1 Tax=Melastoma candidum TaxID=119954 RepID=A0ACB9QP80_9MYRT|nr:hypothetical protein MLD38_016817 [Melastoma candidum]
MPLFELLRTMRSKLDTDPASSSAPVDPSPAPGSNFGELVQEDGQILVQGQSQLNRPRMTGFCTGLSQPRNWSETESRQKAGKIRGLEFGLGEIDLDQDGNAGPWLSYPFNGSLHSDEFWSDLLPELPGIGGVADCRKNLMCNVVEAGPAQPGCLSPDSSALQQQQQSWLPFSLYRSRFLEDAGKVKAMAAEDQGRVDRCATENGQTGCVATEEGRIKAEGEKNVDHGTSSVCSWNTVERGTCYPKHLLKRKSRDNDGSDGPSEVPEDFIPFMVAIDIFIDVNEEPASEKTRVSSGSRSTTSKRSRAAEVHNLSERRRRDRINEKMRVLQDLIPNCNKADKASILDEAIKYLKMLQLQVQMMTMGAGLYMRPPMLPTGIHNMLPFPHTGLGGLGPGIGYGATGLNTSNSVTDHPLVHIPPLAQLPATHRGMLQKYPGQGIPMFMPRKSFHSISAASLAASIRSRHGVAPATTGSSSRETVPRITTPTNTNPVCSGDWPPTQVG